MIVRLRQQLGFSVITRYQPECGINKRKGGKYTVEPFPGSILCRVILISHICWV